MATFTIPELGEFEFNRRRLLNTEALLLERVTGRRLGEIVEDFNQHMGPLGVTAFVWLSMRRAGHHVKYDELEFDIAQVKYSLADETDEGPAQGAESPDPPAAAEQAAAPPTAPRTAGRSKRK